MSPSGRQKKLNSNGVKKMTNLQTRSLPFYLKRLAIVLAVMALPAIAFAQAMEVRDWSNSRLDQGVITHSRTWWVKDRVADIETPPVVSPNPTPKVTVDPPTDTDEGRPTIVGPPIPFGNLGLIQRIHFDFDKSSIRTDQEPQLKKNLKWLLENPKAGVLLEGHCDERGTNRYNVALGERRAAAVKAYLIRGGVAANRIITKSWGEERPLDFGKTEKAYALNRRVEFFKVDIQ